MTNHINIQPVSSNDAVSGLAGGIANGIVSGIANGNFAEMEIMPLRFGTLTIKFPFIQAALSGYSDLPMRMISRRFGAEFTISEVLLDQFVVTVSNRKSRLYFAGEEEHPCGVQLMGNEPNLMCRAVERLIDAGFDLVDLNFACPVKKVLSRGRGGWLLNEPDIAIKIIEQISRVISGAVPLTIKLRKGFDDTQLSRNNFFKILDNAVDLGVQGVTVHGRTVKQRYEGTSDWNFIRSVKEYLVEGGNSKLAVVGSGDIFDAETALLRLRESCVDGIALARGAIGNPWIFRNIKSLVCGQGKLKPPNLQEQKDVLKIHFDLTVNLYGESKAPTTMRAFAVHYCKLHPEMAEVRADFVRVKNVNDWNKVLEKWY
ncbi:MAG: tRNA-dihydrouridine synthase family protein [Planctomycetaceae bacterium]|jgi:nifR3 family TIM-barrel protein|nr:tRNA-dihydrouridine synthase family protein [Planctomycetaceae bacterium]